MELAAWLIEVREALDRLAGDANSVVRDWSDEPTPHAPDAIAWEFCKSTRLHTAAELAGRISEALGELPKFSPIEFAGATVAHVDRVALDRLRRRLEIQRRVALAHGDDERLLMQTSRGAQDAAGRLVQAASYDAQALMLAHVDCSLSAILRGTWTAAPSLAEAIASFTRADGEPL